ncbi:hypothetical protein LCGC14_0095510 [marine sediment metagenome]|uniref:Uncharacterized protein n=1 Tax=marine sediment metagenome TaxID=412755 RepID=A0A0F9YGS3_9ZZZZ|nr:hypothetical protein [Phycisphaerae bacterium]HDZ45118.1 hypothetical protein [Phycisphaerae bacterium]
MLGMYVHTHWGYNHPYAARTWTIDDWRGYLTGLSRLGYDTVMIWPQCDSMPPEPTESDLVWLTRLGEVVDIAHRELAMKVLMVLCPNTIGNEASATYAFTARPYFVTEKKINPADPAEREMFIEGRRKQLSPIAKADALVIIDSDPGGYPGATGEQFVDLLVDQVEVFRSFNPAGEFVYWMWSGWDATCRFWAAADEDGEADHPAQTADEFVQTLQQIAERVPEPWWVLASFPSHNEALDATGLRSKAMWNPYGLIEGEPTFPLTNYHVDKVAETVTSAELARYPLGVMGNSQTHCLQLPLTYAFSRLAQGAPRDEIDLKGFAERLVPGLGQTISAGWELIESDDADAQRAAAKRVQDAVWSVDGIGALGGLLFGGPERFMTDLAMNLEVRAAINDLTHSDSPDHMAGALRSMLDVVTPYQRRLGFTDACYGPLYAALSDVLGKLDDDGLNTALARWTDWSDPTVRNGAFVALLDAAESFCRRSGSEMEAK